uniref:AAA domain-containing protein n=1 Tax=Syphacia muris TaxID=451379 RepID=A0A0N5ATC9_9BILA
MEKVKKVLTEVFIWPSKYSKLFQNCPIKIGRGVLLYGPSGCGKTLIAKVVASESSFSVIHIKGPELLSKYIGQSEKNVRDVFERARMSQPCLVFFDEFDSLAVKRGNDFTGVTDRVVNQLLTELDGLEDGGGVYVIATTNRVDLIDSAVIRPGRFDFLLECALPSQDDRIKILKVLTRKLRIHDSVDYALIASKTDGWSGADLKGLVTLAQSLAEASSRNILKGILTAY